MNVWHLVALILAVAVIILTLVGITTTTAATVYAILSVTFAVLGNANPR